MYNLDLNRDNKSKKGVYNTVFENINKIQSQLHALEMDYWLNKDLFSGSWWIIVLFNLLFLTFLVVLMDKQRILLISFVFLINFIFIGLTDEIGNFFGFWNYPHQLIPFLESFNAVDFLVVPVMFTLMYQTFSKWRSYLIANFIVSAVIAYIGIPLSVYFNLYNLLNWSPTYSFFTLVIIGCSVKLIVNYIKEKSILYTT
jgi:hypothetical protein